MSMAVKPESDGNYTYEDLMKLPEGLRCEVIGGVLYYLLIRRARRSGVLGRKPR